MLPVDPPAVIEVTQDLGGSILDYLRAVNAIKDRGSHVRVDGVCGSACTLILLLPPDKICITRRAQFVFHKGNGSLARDILWAAYPQSVRRWIEERGGLQPDSLSLKGPDLQTILPSCESRTVGFFQSGGSNLDRRISCLRSLRHARPILRLDCSFSQALPMPVYPSHKNEKDFGY